MKRHPNHITQATTELMLTDGGLETTMIYDHGIDLPEFASFVLLDSARGREVLRTYYRRYLDLAAAQGLGFVLESPTWRASRDWGAQLGYNPIDLADVNRRAIRFLAELREEYRSRIPQQLISGCLGPRGDGYVPDDRMTPSEATIYHRQQIAALATTEADLVTAFTLNYADEAVGMARAASAERMPVVIGFTVETDGRLPSGETLATAISRVDSDRCSSPVHYMVNCAHPDHFAHVFDGLAWTRRIKAIRANASRCSHAELEAMTRLDAGDPADFGSLYRDLLTMLPNLKVLGGCCGTDHRHLQAVCRELSVAA